MWLGKVSTAQFWWLKITYIGTEIIGKPQPFVHCYIFIIYLLVFIFPSVNYNFISKPVQLFHCFLVIFHSKL